MPYNIAGCCDIDKHSAGLLIYLFLFLLFNLYIYSPGLQESDEGADT